MMLRLLATGCAFAAAMFGAATAFAQDKVTFRLNWILYGFHTPFYLGLERGYYREEGIDLTIGEGQGSVRAAQTVGAKGDMFGADAEDHLAIGGGGCEIIIRHRHRDRALEEPVFQAPLQEVHRG